MPDAISALNIEPSFDFKFTDGALNGLDALAGCVGNRLIGRPRLLGVAVQMRGDDVERHGPGAAAQFLVAFAAGVIVGGAGVGAKVKVAAANKLTFFPAVALKDALNK